MPYFPHYDIYSILLPDINNSMSPCVFYHFDRAAGNSLSGSALYNYKGNWPTSCKTKGRQQILTFMQDPKNAKAEFSLLNVDSKIDDISNEKIPIGQINLIYVLSGSVEICLNSFSSILESNVVLICEGNTPENPLNISIEPINGTAAILIISLNILNNVQSISETGFDKVMLRKESFNNYCFSEAPYNYVPPVFSDRHKNEVNVPPAVVRDTLDISEYPRGQISTAWINIMKQG